MFTGSVNEELNPINIGNFKLSDYYKLGTLAPVTTNGSAFKEVDGVHSETPYKYTGLLTDNSI